MTITPLISVIMPVYNAERYLKDAIDSILKQSFRDFELIIINDGSNDGSSKIIEDFAKSDDRIRTVNRENRGLISSLNEALSLARGTYIARMDADDVAETNRFEKQLQYLTENPTVSVVGSRAIAIDENGNRLRKISTPCSNYILKAMNIFGNCIIHPSVMINKTLVSAELYYDRDAVHAEDYELWLRLSDRCNARFHVLQDPLLLYRVLPNSISRSNAKQQLEMSAFLQKKYLFKDGAAGAQISAIHSLKSLFMDQKKLNYLPIQIIYLARWHIRNFFKQSEH